MMVVQGVTLLEDGVAAALVPGIHHRGDEHQGVSDQVAVFQGETGSEGQGQQGGDQGPEQGADQQQAQQGEHPAHGGGIVRMPFEDVETADFAGIPLHNTFTCRGVWDTRRSRQIP